MRNCSVRETSIEAFHAHGTMSAQQRSRILAFIRSRGGDWSIGEIAWAMDLQKSTVSARINELVNETGELEERPRRKDRISNITVRPVALPAIQLDLFR